MDAPTNFDISKIAEVCQTESEREANELLASGWILLGVFQYRDDGDGLANGEYKLGRY